MRPCAFATRVVTWSCPSPLLQTTVKPHQVKNHLFVFVRALIDNPAFDSQVRQCAVCAVTLV